MKNLFLMSHVGADYGRLIDCLEEVPEIQCCYTEMNYDHPDRFIALSESPHKCYNAASIYMDLILQNRRFQRNMIFPSLKFIFYFGEPKSSITKVAEEVGMENALAHYAMRLEGMYEFACRSRGVLCKWDSFDLENIRQYVGIKKPLRIAEPDLGSGCELSSAAQKIFDDLMQRDHRLLAVLG